MSAHGQMPAGPRLRPVERVDPVWARIREEAEDVGQVIGELGACLDPVGRGALLHEDEEDAAFVRLAEELVSEVQSTGGVEVEVADEGEGISPDDSSHVFDAFYRGDAARAEDGAGLGLAISRAIVEAHGGKIWLEQGSPGTRVHFTLRGA